MVKISVDFPQPFGPRIATCSPVRILRFTSSSTTRSPRATFTWRNSRNSCSWPSLAACELGCSRSIKTPSSPTSGGSLRSGLLLDFGPGVLQRERPVEDQIARFGVGIEAEVADALKLKSVLKFGVGKRWFQLGARENLQ